MESIPEHLSVDTWNTTPQKKGIKQQMYGLIYGIKLKLLRHTKNLI